MKIKNILWIAIVLFSFGCQEDEDGVQDPSGPTLSILTNSISEGVEDQMQYINLELSEASERSIVIDYHVSSGTAVIGKNDDLVLKSTTQLVINPGETTARIGVEVKADDFFEGVETFNLVIEKVNNGQLSEYTYVISISDEDDPSSNELNIPTAGYTTPSSYSGMTLVWGDEFNGSSLNATDWGAETGTGNNGWGNEELQYYQAENASIVNGNLVITAREETIGNSNYTSSRITTKNKQEFQYGRVDIRAAMPETQGLWPALWTLGANIDDVSWPACGEIDIMEMKGQSNNIVYGTCHYPDNDGNHQFTGGNKVASGANLHEEFHVYSIVWEENKIEWYLDDVLYKTVTPSDLVDGNFAPFNNGPFFFVLNVAVGGEFVGDPDQSTSFPQHMIVDYVRVFQ